MYKTVISAIVLALCVVISSFVGQRKGFQSGYEEGRLDVLLEGLHFDLSIYRQAYEMSDYVHSLEKEHSLYIAHPRSWKTLIYGRILLYDEMSERYDQIVGVTSRFEEDLERARSIVKDVQLLRIGEGITHEFEREEELSSDSSVTSQDSEPDVVGGTEGNETRD